MTKSQIQSKLRKLIDKLSNLRIEFGMLQDNVQETIDGIEPYENRDELTEQQEAKQEWLENVLSTLEDTDSELEEVESNLEDCEMDW